MQTFEIIVIGLIVPVWLFGCSKPPKKRDEGLLGGLLLTIGATLGGLWGALLVMDAAEFHGVAVALRLIGGFLLIFLSGTFLSPRS